MDKWLQHQLEKFKAFADIVVTLTIDALLLVVMWWLKKKVFEITGIIPEQIKDPLFKSIVIACEYGTFIALIIYILMDILKGIQRAFNEIAKNKKVKSKSRNFNKKEGEVSEVKENINDL